MEMDDFGLSLPRIEPRSTTREAKSNAAVFELVVLCKLDDVCNICRDGIRLEHTLLPYMTIVLHNDDISYIKTLFNNKQQSIFSGPYKIQYVNGIMAEI